MIVDMGACTDRVTHVVQAVEEADQVEVTIERRRGGGLEADPFGKASVGGSLTRGVDRALVGVEADDAGGRVGLGEQQCRCAVATADVDDSGAGRELGLDAIERWNPCAGEVVEVAGPEEALASVQDMGILGAPGEPGSGAESLGDRVRGVNRADGDFKSTDYLGRAGFVGDPWVRHQQLDTRC